MPLRIVVSDSSCLVDLRKVSLLEAFIRLPYEFLIPNTLYEDELLKFTPAQKTDLVKGGLKVIDLPGTSVTRVQKLVQTSPRLSVHDGFAFVLAEDNPGCILLTGDGELRKLANTTNIEVHGVLWVIDELHRCGLTELMDLVSAVTLFSTDPTVRLPRRDVLACMKRLEKAQQAPKVFTARKNN